MNKIRTLQFSLKCKHPKSKNGGFTCGVLGPAGELNEIQHNCTYVNACGWQSQICLTLISIVRLSGEPLWWKLVV